MALTHINCFFYRGRNATNDTSSYVALNAEKTPGSMILAGSCAARESIGSQVACRLSLEHFVSGVLDYFFSKHNGDQDQKAEQVAVEENPDKSLEVLEAAFRKANSSVYSFGHKLAAGGRMAASLIGLVIEDNMIASGRVGAGSAYLYRGQELFPFFAAPETKETHKSNDDFVGAHSMVSVELASVPIEQSDTIFVFSSCLSPAEEEELIRLNKDISFNGSNSCFELANFLFDNAEELPFIMLVQVGPETIYLSEAVNK